jgi:glycosyltransferase involved in cell wall biosynthesis
VFDVYLLPSLWEGLPVSLIEAQANGLPCIVSNAITMQVDISKKMEFLPIDDNSIGVWKDAIIKYANSGCEREAGYNKLKDSEFNIKNCCNALLGFYRGQNGFDI